MKKFCSLIFAIILAFCVLFVGCEHDENVFSLYANGTYENTLSQENRYLLSDADTVKKKINSETGILFVLIGAPWCPYCASDIGPIDERFQKSPLSQTAEHIYYIDVADSEHSAETIMDFNRTYDWNMRTRIPCLMAITNGSLIAVITDETFTGIENRTERIEAFFSYAENSHRIPAVSVYK